jgi:hypothetical protein
LAFESAGEGGDALGDVLGDRQESVSQPRIDVKFDVGQSAHRALEEIEAGKLIAISG